MFSSSLVRRTLNLSSSLLKTPLPLHSLSSISSSNPPTSPWFLHKLHSHSSDSLNPTVSLSSIFSSVDLHRTLSLSSSLLKTPFRSLSSIASDDPDITGVDFKHWLIMLEFPEFPETTPAQKVETYVQMLAKVVGSVEEAKKKMYACSTTTYTGFQAEITKEEAKKFEGFPEVVFILPDSYIDQVNKEYGGDKYINGTIIPS